MLLAPPSLSRWGKGLAATRSGPHPPPPLSTGGEGGRKRRVRRATAVAATHRTTETSSVGAGTPRERLCLNSCVVPGSP